MGLNRFKRTPCGFCFLEFYDFNDAKLCFLYIYGFELDQRIIKIDLDEGFCDGRQFGRGARGGQIQNDARKLDEGDFFNYRKRFYL